MIHTQTFSRAFKSRCMRTDAVLQVSQMFGLGIDEDHEVSLYEKLKVSFGAGKIVYITGESGAGKTSLLRDIRDEAHKAGFAIPDLVDGKRQKPLVDLFEPFEHAMTMLTLVGLAEPFVMCRTPEQLSDGQRYRLMLGLQMDMAERTKKPPLVVMDEFLANLDRETAKAVAYQTRKVANQGKIGFVVATTHRDIEDDLQPDCRILLRLGRKPDREVRLA